MTPTNILFICGGAFEGLDKIIERRMDQRTIGFGAELGKPNEEDKTWASCCASFCRRIW